MSKNWIDQSWREFLSENLGDAVAFLIPEIVADWDYSREPILLSNEQAVIGSDSNKGARYADLVVSIPLKTEVDHRLILHVEQQHAHDQNLPLRMYQSHYRMSDQHQIPVTSLAILTGKRTGELDPVSTYTYRCYGTEILFKYNVFDVNGVTEEKLKSDPRIFAVVILAAKKMLDAGGDARKRGKFALELLELLKERGYDKKKAESLQRFIGQILQIKNNDIDSDIRKEWDMLSIPIDEAVKKIHVRVATEQGMERGMKKGREEGREVGREEGKGEKALQVARSMLEDGFSPEVIKKYTDLDIDTILAPR